MNQALPLHDASKPARQNDERASAASCSAHQLFLLLQREHAASLSVLQLFQLTIPFHRTVSCLSLFSYVTYMLHYPLGLHDFTDKEYIFLLHRYCIQTYWSVPDWYVASFSSRTYVFFSFCIFIFPGFFILLLVCPLFISFFYFFLYIYFIQSLLSLSLRYFLYPLSPFQYSS